MVVCRHASTWEYGNMWGPLVLLAAARILYTPPPSLPTLHRPLVSISHFIFLYTALSLLFSALLALFIRSATRTRGSRRVGFSAISQFFLLFQMPLVLSLVQDRSKTLYFPFPLSPRAAHLGTSPFLCELFILFWYLSLLRALCRAFGFYDWHTLILYSQRFIAMREEKCWFFFHFLLQIITIIVL